MAKGGGNNYLSPFGTKVSSTGMGRRGMRSSDVAHNFGYYEDDDLQQSIKYVVLSSFPLRQSVRK